MLLKCEVKIVQSCPTLCDSKDYRVHRILQARILEWVTFPFSRGSSQQVKIFSRGLNPGLLHFTQILYHLSHQGSPTREVPLLQTKRVLLCISELFGES